MSKQINRRKKMMTTTVSHCVFESIERLSQELGVNKNRIIEQAVSVFANTQEKAKKDHKKTPSAN